MSDSISQLKNILRREARNRRKQHAANHPSFSTFAAPDEFLKIITAGNFVASYRPTGSEADPGRLEACARKHGGQLCWPRVDPDGAMRFYAFPKDQEARWRKDAAGTMAPTDTAIAVDPDIILLPLLAFDRLGTRLGQGGGHYDRALAAISTHQPLKIGVAWSIQEMPDMPRESWDIPLDAVLTEKEWIVTS